MRTEPPSLPQFQDPLGETLHLLRLTGTLYCRAELTEPWGIDLPPFEGCMMFHLVTSGRGVLEVGGETHELTPGSLVLIPHGTGHRLLSATDVDADSLFDIPVEKLSERYEVMNHGGGGAKTQTLCVVVRFDHVAARHLVAQLPSVLQMDGWDSEETLWLQSTLRLISREARELRPGGETMVTRLADVLVIQMIRRWIENEGTEHGWLRALKDHELGKALGAFHREPGLDWTVASLAKVACLSRSAFSARFSETVGESAMRYVTRWRMQLAHQKLRESATSVAALSDSLGYQSEAAFCRAFKRMFGCSPGSVRKGE